MKIILNIVFCTVVFFAFLGCNNQSVQNTNKYIIEKENGKIILAYKAFQDFLNSDKSWESYKALLLDAYPEVQEVHKRS